MRAKLLRAAALVPCTSCSIVAVRSSPTINESIGVGVCGTALAPTADVAGVVAFGLLGVFLSSPTSFGECSNRPNDPCHSHWEACIPAGIAAVSAVYGFWAVHHCNQQLDAMHAQYLATHPAEPAAPQ